MQESYAKAMQEASEILTQAVLETEPNLEEVAREVDGLIRSLLRVTGRLTMEAILGEARRRVTEAAQREGMRVHRRKGVRFFGLFGPMEVDSPYLYDRMGGRSARPVKDRLGIMHQGRSRVVDRALTDFGVEESFGQAARRFQEHYGWSVGRSTVLRVVEDEAESAQAYVESRLEEERSAFEEPLTSRPGADQVLIELDGCSVYVITIPPSPHTQEITEWFHIPKLETDTTTGWSRASKKRKVYSEGTGAEKSLVLASPMEVLVFIPIVIAPTVESEYSRTLDTPE